MRVPAPPLALSRRQGLALLGFGTVALALGPQWLAAQAAETTVSAHNRAPGGAQMAFAPAVVHVALGARVRFALPDRGHNVQSFDSMRPDGAPDFGGAINQEIEVVFDLPGTYGYYCRPHQAMGMIGFVLVGDFTGNLDQVRAATAALRGPMLARRSAGYLAEIDAIGREAGLI